jgi:hypothetical protein
MATTSFVAVRDMENGLDGRGIIVDAATVL